MAVFADGLIEAACGPRELGAADSLEDVVVDFVDGARRKLDVAVQEIDNARTARAILAAHWRGVKVEVFLEQDYLRPARRPRVRPRAGETLAEAQERLAFGPDEASLARNREILTAFLRAGIEVRGDFNPEIFHQKFIVRDIASPQAALLTGSANFTDTDFHRNLNHVVVFRHRGIAQEYARQFEQLRNGMFGRNVMGDVPRTYDLAGVPVKVLFAPDHTPELEIIKQALKIGTRGDLRFAIFTFAGSSGIDDALLMLSRAGCDVRGVVDRGQAAQAWSAVRWLHGSDVQLFQPSPTSGVRKLHHKLMVVDRATVLAGSFNYTRPANEFNDENLFVLGSPHDEVERRPVDHDRCRQLADFFRTEIDRIIDVSERLDGH